MDCVCLVSNTYQSLFNCLCSSQNEGSSDQPRVVAFPGLEVGGALLLREGEEERSGLLLLYDSALLHYGNGGVHRSAVSSHI